MKIRAVTMLYDIGRSKIDGRELNSYLLWLNQTLKLPISFTIYTNLKNHNIELKEGDELIEMALSDFGPYKWLARIESIAQDPKSNIKATNDITYLLPHYSIVQFSKLHAIEMAQIRHNCDHLFWIDAGLSRFYLQRSDDTNYHFNNEKMGSLAITPTLLKDLKNKKAANYAGTCERLVCGEFFHINGSFASQAKKAIYDYAESEWLDKKIWDNEQVALGEFISRNPNLFDISDTSGIQSKLATQYFDISLKSQPNKFSLTNIKNLFTYKK